MTILLCFLYRVETIGWISKLKFEEIWMAFLGILNLNNEDQIRPEEQASVVQVGHSFVNAFL